MGRSFVRVRGTGGRRRKNPALADIGWVLKDKPKKRRRRNRKQDRVPFWIRQADEADEQMDIQLSRRLAMED